MSSQKMLEEFIISRSVWNKSWSAARSEWDLHMIYRTDQFEACPCGTPIKELCVIVNRKNLRSAIVGNICVDQFMKLQSKRMFASVRRVLKDDLKSFHMDLMELVHKRRIIEDGDLDFYAKVHALRALQIAAKQKKRRINHVVLGAVCQPHVNLAALDPQSLPALP